MPTEEAHIARAAAAFDDPDVRRDATRDALVHGTGIMRDGKRIDPAEFFAQRAVDPPREAPEPDADAVSRFAAWFRRNYPGPDTIIYDPDWHAPRILAAARAALTAAPQPAPVAREALVGVIDLVRRAWAAMRPDGISENDAIANSLLAAGLRLPGVVQPDETLAWAVVGEDGRIKPSTLAWDYDGAARHEAGGEETVRVHVAIRIVEGGDDAA